MLLIRFVIKSLNEKPDGQRQQVSVACHVHSDWSYDGKWSLSDLAQAFAGRGYDVVMMTEHDRGFTEPRWSAYRAACAAASSEKVLLVPGIEYSDADNIVHILAWGCSSFLGEGLATPVLLEAVRQQGGVAVLAHSSRREAWRRFEPSWSANLFGIEVWNRKTDGWAPSRTASLCRASAELVRFAGLDFHGRRQFFPLAMRVDVASPVTEQSILGALLARRVRPFVFGRPLLEELNPAVSLALSSAESVRRVASRGVRTLTGLIGVEIP